MIIKTGIYEDGDPCGLLAGPRVGLDSSFPALRPCRFCSHTTGVLIGPTQHHADGVRCEKCHRHIGWLPASFHGLAEPFDVIEDAG